MAEGEPSFVTSKMRSASLICAAPTLQVRMYSRALAIIGGFLIMASGAGEVYRQKARSRSLQSTGQVFLGVFLICMVSVFS